MTTERNSYNLDGWEDRLGDPGQTLPSKAPLVIADEAAVLLVCACFKWGVVLFLISFVGWAMWPARAA